MSHLGRIQTLLLMAVLVSMMPLATAQSIAESGSRAPQFDVRLIDGTTLSRADQRGKVMLTVFWATWCPICMRELPAYQLLRDRHHGAGFEVLALSVDDGPAVVRDYLRRSGVTLPVAMRTARLKTAWGPVQGTPLLYLSDRSGRVRVRHLGAVELEVLEAQIVALLAEAMPSRAVIPSPQEGGTSMVLP